MIGGLEGDGITLGDGRVTILGDHGTVQYNAAGLPILAFSSQTTPELGGDDVILIGEGFDWVIGGTGADNIAIGSGGGIVLGDLGRIEVDGDSRPVLVQTTNSRIGGADVVTAGDGNTVVMGGRGADRITTAGGDDVILGDEGQLTLAAGIRLRLDGPILDPAEGGDDTIATGAGNDWIIGGEGGDDIANAAGDAVVIGDAGFITADLAGIANRAETTQIDIGGADRFVGGAGREIFLGGAGNDLGDLGAGRDYMTGDGGIYHREGPVGSGLTTFETLGVGIGGSDTLLGGPGQDVLFGGVGNDSFELDFDGDIAAGEYARVRFQENGDTAGTVVSFISPSMRDADLILQRNWGMNRGGDKTVMIDVAKTQQPLQSDAFVVLRLDGRGDLVLVDEGLAAAAVLAGLGAPVQGATLLTEDSLFTPDEIGGALADLKAALAAGQDGAAPDTGEGDEATPVNEEGTTEQSMHAPEVAEPRWAFVEGWEFEAEVA